MAEELKIKGLTQSTSSTQPESHKSKGVPPPPGISNTTNSTARKRSTASSQPRLEEDQEEIQEIPTIKTEPGGQSLAQYQGEEEEEVVGDYDYEDQEVQYDNTLTSARLDYEQGKVSGESVPLSVSVFPCWKTQKVKARCPLGGSRLNVDPGYSRRQ